MLCSHYVFASFSYMLASSSCIKSSCVSYLFHVVLVSLFFLRSQIECMFLSYSINVSSHWFNIIKHTLLKYWQIKRDIPNPMTLS